MESLFELFKHIDIFLIIFYKYFTNTQKYYSIYYIINIIQL